MHAQGGTRACVHMHTRTHVRVSVLACVRACVRACMRGCVRVRVLAYTGNGHLLLEDEQLPDMTEKWHSSTTEIKKKVCAYVMSVQACVHDVHDVRDLYA